MDTFNDYIGYFFRQFPAKTLFASITAYCATYFGIEAAVFYWYCIFAVFDLLVGMWYAAAFGASYVRFARMWFYRLAVQLGIIALVGGLFHMLFAITGHLIEVVNGMFMVCSVVAFGSALDKLAFMGVPLPAFLMPLVNALRRRLSYHLSNVVRDPRLADELNASLAARGVAEKRREDEPVLEEVRDG